MKDSKMWLLFLKTFLYLYLTNSVHSYQFSGSSSKTYVNTKWRNKYDTKNSLTTSTLSPWNKKYHHTTVKPTHLRHSDLRLRHSRFPNLDGVMSRLDQIKTTTTSSPYKLTWKNRLRHENDDVAVDNYDELEYEDDVEEDADELPDYDKWVSVFFCSSKIISCSFL